MSGTFQIKRANADDHGAIAPLFERFYREEGLAHASGVVADNLHGVLTRDDTAAFVAESAGAVVGVAAVSTAYGLEVGLYAELEDLYVLPEWRAAGVGSALIGASVAWARGLGCHDIGVVLTAHAQTKPDLVAWYAKRGFEETGRRYLELELDDGS